MAIKPRKEIQRNHEKYSADFKKAEKTGEWRTKNRWKNFKIEEIFKPTISKIIENINDLNIHIKMAKIV